MFENLLQVVGDQIQSITINMEYEITPADVDEFFALIFHSIAVTIMTVLTYGGEFVSLARVWTIFEIHDAHQDYCSEIPLDQTNEEFDELLEEDPLTAIVCSESVRAFVNIASFIKTLPVVAYWYVVAELSQFLTPENPVEFEQQITKVFYDFWST